eukprot:scaffold72626_cov61-Phaeocystis_antarctica.AAC.3
MSAARMLKPQQTRPTAPRPGAAASAGRGGIPGRSRARSSAARRAAARGTRAWARRPEAVFEGARRTGGGVNEAMGESRAESLVGYLGRGGCGRDGRIGHRGGRVGRGGRRRGAP